MRETVLLFYKSKTYGSIISMGNGYHTHFITRISIFSLISFLPVFFLTSFFIQVRLIYIQSLEQWKECFFHHENYYLHEMTLMFYSAVNAGSTLNNL